MHTQNACRAILELLDIMKTLRSPEGCPWDAQQSPQSLARYVLEEAAELVDAIESQASERIKDEAGDLLLQVVFLAQIFSERGQFNFADIAAGISRKLIRRHPHVFAEQKTPQSQTDLDRQWEHIKRQEKLGCDDDPHPMAGIPVSLPALQRAQKLLDRAAKADLQIPAGAIAEPDPADPLTDEVLGQALFALVFKAHRSGLDPEKALRIYLRKMLEQWTGGADHPQGKSQS